MSDVDRHQIVMPGAALVAGDGQRWDIDPHGGYGREVEYETIRSNGWQVADPAWASACRAGCGTVHRWLRRDDETWTVENATEVPSAPYWCETCRDHHAEGELSPTYVCATCGFMVVPVTKHYVPDPVRIVRSDRVTVDILCQALPSEVLGASVEWDQDSVTHRLAMPPVLRPYGDVAFEHGAPMRVTLGGDLPPRD